MGQSQFRLFLNLGARRNSATAAAASEVSIALTWIPPDEDGGSPIIGYALYGGVTGGPIHPLYDPLRAGDVVDPQKREFTVHGLYPATNYSFQVAVDNERGRSMFSELASFRTTPKART